MSTFDTLIIGHLVGDFMLQNNWMASQKAISWVARLVHSTIYALAICLFAWIFSIGLTFSGFLVVISSHFIIDKRILVPWWVATVMKTKGPESNWLEIVVDQIFHLLFLTIAIHI